MSKTSSNDKSIAPATAPTPDQVPGVFRLDSMSAGAAGGDQPQVQFAAPKRRVSSQIIALALVLVVGGGLLYVMRLMGINPLKNIATAKMPDYDLAQLGTNKTADHQRVINELTANYSESQVPLDQVQRNPFRMPDALVKPDIKPIEDNSRAGAEAQRRAAEARKSKIAAALGLLKLNGVLGGSTPVARISGDAVRVGDVVGEYFTVKAIHGRSVELSYEDQTYTLTMDDDAKNSTKHPGKK